MNPLLILSIVGLTAASLRQRTPARQGRRQLRGETFRPHIVVVNDCQAWSIPDAWWLQVAQPRFAQLVQQGERDVALITYALLDDEVGDCPLPPSMEVDVDAPTAENFWPGPPQMLFLVQHVAEDVRAGVTHFEETGDPHLPILRLFGQEEAQ